MNTIETRIDKTTIQAIVEHFVLSVEVITRSPEVLAAQHNNPYSSIHRVLKGWKAEHLFNN